MYKIGNRVQVKSREWYENNKNKDGCVEVGADLLFTAEMEKYCGVSTALMTTQVSPSQGTHYVRKGVRCSWMRGMRVVGRSKYHIIME